MTCQNEPSQTQREDNNSLSSTTIHWLTLNMHVTCTELLTSRATAHYYVMV